VAVSDDDIAAESDGRKLRRGANREAVLDALVELYREGQFEPSSNEIAERAGLSPRSLFRYFDDVDDLSHAAIDRQLRNARPLLDLGVGPDEPTAIKVAQVVESRLRLFEATAPPARAARVCAHRHPVIAAQLHEGRTYLRHQVRKLFASELAGVRANLVSAVDVLCSFETYELLRTDQGLSRAKTAASLVDALTALLDPHGGCS